MKLDSENIFRRFKQKTEEGEQERAYIADAKSKRKAWLKTDPSTLSDRDRRALAESKPDPNISKQILEVAPKTPAPAISSTRINLRIQEQTGDSTIGREPKFGTFMYSLSDLEDRGLIERRKPAKNGSTYRYRLPREDEDR
jgi:hypothetical protein